MGDADVEVPDVVAVPEMRRNVNHGTAGIVDADRRAALDGDRNQAIAVEIHAALWKLSLVPIEEELKLAVAARARLDRDAVRAHACRDGSVDAHACGEP